MGCFLLGPIYWQWVHDKSRKNNTWQGLNCVFKLNVRLFLVCCRTWNLVTMFLHFRLSFVWAEPGRDSCQMLVEMKWYTVVEECSHLHHLPVCIIISEKCISDLSNVCVLYQPKCSSLLHKCWLIKRTKENLSFLSMTLRKVELDSVSQACICDSG